MIGILTDEMVRRRFDPRAVESTKDPGDGIVGQGRAVAGLQFGLGIQQQGFNVFVVGPPGLGKMTAVRSFLEKIAGQNEPPPDWCYVNNFNDPAQPKALRLPSGWGKPFQQDLKNLVDHLRNQIPKAFESEDYLSRREAVIKELDDKRGELLEQMNRDVSRSGFMVETTPAGFHIIPEKDGKPLTEKEAEKMPPEAWKELRRRRAALQEETKLVLKKLRDLDHSTQERVQEIDRQTIVAVFEDLIHELMQKYHEFPEVQDYLQEVRKDIPQNREIFKLTKSQTPASPLSMPWFLEQPFRAYDVNVFVDNRTLKGAPVIVEGNPTYINLFGRTEKESQFGSLHTDFTLLRAGSLHTANGGYIVIQAEDLLRNAFCWDNLKRVLRSGQIDMDEPLDRVGLIATKSLRPQPIPIQTKVVLLGSPYIYYLLHLLDEDFAELFKVKAEFDEKMPVTEENISGFLSFLCNFCKKENIKPLDPSAAAKILEHSCRIAEDQQKLSTHFTILSDVIREAHHWAMMDKQEEITATHVQKALNEKVYRSNLLQEKVRESMDREFILIETKGKAIGQVNGLSYLAAGEYSFGKPSRITATVGAGKEGVIDIEREAKLGGPIHSKGVLILSGYLTERFGKKKPVALNARLVFEQSYGGVEGDSASSAELVALLSAICQLSLEQGIAITGSVNQHGMIQAVGGINQKIEGFFDLCDARRLTGTQGVIIPKSNIQNLMLREDVAEAIREKKFHIWTVTSIEEAMEILTGIPAGERLEDGTYPEDSVNFLLEERLNALSESVSKQDDWFSHLHRRTF